MTYDYNNETGILTYEVTPKENDQMRLAMLPPGTAEPGATALRIIEHKRNEMLEAFGRCEVRVIVSNESSSPTAADGNGGAERKRE